MRYLFSVLILLVISACSNPKSFSINDKPTWLPSESKLSQGVVSKFYKADIRGEGKRDAGDISYRSYQLIGDNLLEVISYNAGYQMESKSTFKVENQKMILQSQLVENAGDTIEAIISNSSYYSWDPNNLANSSITVNYNEKAKYQTKSQQVRVFDIESLNKTGVSFEFNVSSQNLANEASQPRTSLVTTTFLEGIGLFAEEVISGERKLQVELIEQFPLSEFEKRSNHGLTRVAYINPDQKIDTISWFAPCLKPQRILDYYNTTPYAQYTGGNFKLQEYIKSNLDATLFQNESGYLVYRFVVNCEGKAGWFVTEQYDLDYQPKDFNQKLVDHLLKPLVAVDSWTPGLINGTARDSYVYITFKFKDGELIEILP